MVAWLRCDTVISAGVCSHGSPSTCIGALPPLNVIYNKHNVDIKLLTHRNINIPLRHRLTRVFSNTFANIYVFFLQWNNIRYKQLSTFHSLQFYTGITIDMHVYVTLTTFACPRRSGSASPTCSCAMWKDEYSANTSIIPSSNLPYTLQSFRIPHFLAWKFPDFSVFLIQCQVIVRSTPESFYLFIDKQVCSILVNIWNRVALHFGIWSHKQFLPPSG